MDNFKVQIIYLHLNKYHLFPGMSKINSYLAVEGLSARLPCDITPPNPGEKVYLVLWYRDDEGEPIYR